MKPVIGILIAVRTGSTRLPKKALEKIEDQTLIEHIIDRMKTCRYADKIVLCTTRKKEDKILVKIAKKKKIYYFCGDEENVIKRFLDAAKKFKLDIIVRVTGDNPLTCPKFIDKAIEYHIKNRCDYTSTKKLPQGTKGEVISISALKKLSRLIKNPKDYITWYFEENSKYFKLCYIFPGRGLIRPNYRLTVDYKEDLDLIREIYKRLYKKGEIIDLKEVVKLLDNNPKLVEINRKIKIKDDKYKQKLKTEVLE